MIELRSNQIVRQRAPRKYRTPSFWKVVSVATAIVSLLLFVPTPSRADIITFPVGTPITVQYPSWICQRDPFVFWRYGGMSINQFSSAWLHSGGLLLNYVDLADPSLKMSAYGQEFSLLETTFVEAPFANGPDGSFVLVYARDSRSGVWFEEELAFDLDERTYDTFDMLAYDSRFAHVDFVSFRYESHVIDPVTVPYLLDKVEAVIVIPEPITPWTLLTVTAAVVLTRRRNLLDRSVRNWHRDHVCPVGRAACIAL